MAKKKTKREMRCHVLVLNKSGRGYKKCDEAAGYICHDCEEPTCEDHISGDTVCAICAPGDVISNTEVDVKVTHRFVGGATVTFKHAPTSDNVTAGVVTTIKLLSITHEVLKQLWDIEHLFNALPSDTRVHIDLWETKK